MSVELLDRIRKVNKLLSNNTSNVFVFNDICLALSDAMGSNVMVLSRKGKILGMGNTDPALIERDVVTLFVALRKSGLLQVVCTTE